MHLLIATTNPGKVREYRQLLNSLNCDLVGLPDVGIAQDVDETGLTYEENALLKAQDYAALSGLLTLADDSGLEVDALGGRPGVHSARYAPDSPARWRSLPGRTSNRPARACGNDGSGPDPARFLRGQSVTPRVSVRTENSALDAIAAVREFHPDLILLDVMMPGLDGGAIAAQLQSGSATRDIPIVFVTAMAQDERNILDGYESGLDAFFSSAIGQPRGRVRP